MSPGARSSTQADSGSSEDEAASEARSTTSDCPSLLSATTEDCLGESKLTFDRGSVRAPLDGAGSSDDQLALQVAKRWTNRASRKTWRRS
jgi:hypothetical protein